MNYLVVVAHPDDEVLGAGGTIYKLTQKDEKVTVCIMSMGALARANRPDDDVLINNSDSAMNALGVKNIIKGTFPNMEMNTVSHLHLVQFIEKAIETSEPDIIFTHHPADTNNDHVQTSLACQAAVRVFQRRDGMKAINEMVYMEVPSSTEWSLDTAANRFQPNMFYEIGEDGVNKKIEALSLYKGVMRDYPHPRSVDALKGLASYRGSQAHLNYAESFELAYRRIL